MGQTPQRDLVGPIRGAALGKDLEDGVGRKFRRIGAAASHFVQCGVLIGDLLAADLDQQTLIAYLDRFMMFYIRTADRLQRTSLWLESLEGGIDYLRKVIIDDKLGLNSQLEQELNRLRASATHPRGGGQPAPLRCPCVAGAT